MSDYLNSLLPTGTSKSSPSVVPVTPPFQRAPHGSAPIPLKTRRSGTGNLMEMTNPRIHPRDARMGPAAAPVQNPMPAKFGGLHLVPISRLSLPVSRPPSEVTVAAIGLATALALLLAY